MKDDDKTPHALGRAGEDLACAYLLKKGYRILERGFRRFRGEIDIVARDGATLVFVEVKARADDTFGRPEESVTPAKQRQIRRIARAYMLEIPPEDAAVRFDVVAILFGRDGAPSLEHFVDAF